MRRFDDNKILQIPPVKTALKLAMHSENGALMQLCAMALKNVYILRSTYPASNLISHLNSVGIISDVDLAKNKVWIHQLLPETLYTHS